ncbi:MAG: enoyl-CoA hydratase/isomerase family protein [Alphaproteobacteria bacterium]|jgi:3-hydroxyacyl-CoA dehydrogenase|nr:enoyl-CoA hydratase/isomerase family protein [Alphaproteobacteria bacterium]MDP6517056.1 enoyl-CoA hydratase/isomerase family protein [Alphaproteobacteria bacterium]
MQEPDATLPANRAAHVQDDGDGIAILKIHRRRQMIDADVLDVVGQSVGLVAARFEGLVIVLDGAEDPIGLDIASLLLASNLAAWWAADSLIETGQRTFRALETAPFPTVAAVLGEAVGGACELALHCAAIQAAPDAKLGLSQVEAGLIPFWGGSTALAGRALAGGGSGGDPIPGLADILNTIATARICQSAAEARALRLLGPNDGVSDHRDQVLADAKRLARDLARDYAPPADPALALPGEVGLSHLIEIIEENRPDGPLAAADPVVLTELAVVLTGGDVTSGSLIPIDDLRRLERGATNFLIQRPETQDRLARMVARDLAPETEG